MKKYLLLFAIVGATVLSACIKNDNSYLDNDKKIQEQFTKDSILMSSFIVTQGIDTSGVRGGLLYEIITPGTGSHVYSANSQVTVKYEGRLLNGNVFDKTTNDAVTFTLGQLVAGWQIGIPLIQKGGKIRIIVPSYYGYGSATKPNIPANSVLDFDIELIDVK